MQRLLLVGLLVLGWVAAAVPASSTVASDSTATVQSLALAQDGGDDFPPGLSESGVTDPLALADAHRDVLENTSYTMVTTFTFQRPDGTVRASGTSTLQVAAGGETYYAATSQTGPNETQLLETRNFALAVWSNETRTLTARDFLDGKPTYESVARKDAPLKPSTQWELLYVAFAATNATVVNQYEENGTTLYRVVSASQPGPNSAYGEDARYSWVAIVDSQGVVRAFQQTYRTEFRGEPRIVSRTMQVTNVGNTSVERPSWYGQAMANVTGESNGTG